MIRSQHQLRRTVRQVASVKGNTDVEDAYGGLCHNVPILIRQSGLCQTVAWIEAKAAQGSNAAAYRLLRRHLAEHLREDLALGGALASDGTNLLTWVQRATTREYMAATRVLLEASIYGRRFAVSMLDVDTTTIDRGDA